MAMCLNLTVVAVVAFLAAAATTTAAQLAGGIMEADLSEERVKNALQVAVVQHNKKNNDMYVSQVSKVIKVQKQVVAGMKYIFTVEMARTTCKKNGVEKQCPIHSDPAMAAPYTCDFEVWSRPWLDDIRVVKDQCKK